MTTPLVQAIQKEIDRTSSRLEVYKKAFADNTLQAIEDHSLQYATRQRIFQRLIQLKKSIESGTRSEAKTLKFFQSEVIKDLINWCPARSSAPMTNLLRECVREGDQEFLEILEGLIVRFGGNDEA